LCATISTYFLLQYVLVAITSIVCIRKYTTWKISFDNDAKHENYHCYKVTFFFHLKTVFKWNHREDLIIVSEFSDFSDLSGWSFVFEKLISIFCILLFVNSFSIKFVQFDRLNVYNYPNKTISRYIVRTWYKNLLFPMTRSSILTNKSNQKFTKIKIFISNSNDVTRSGFIWIIVNVDWKTEHPLP
jgi:hypothetical protein